MNKELSVNELKSRLASGEHIRLVDVRSAQEYAAGHIPGALSVPVEEIESRIEDFHTDDPVLLVCQSGQRAGIACELVRQRMPGIAVLEGGTQAWCEAGLPVVSTRRTRWSLERQVRLMAGALVFAGILLSLSVHPSWLILSGFVSVGLMFAGLTDICPMGMLFGKMPWNRPKGSAQEAARSCV
jgi:rhodanese-related sulfurtransferase